jgi:hypothetical protein
MRKLSDNFMNALKESDGLLHPILERVKQDDTLMLAIRDNYVNIYYRGGNILRFEQQQGKNSYQSSFNNQYNKSGKTIPFLPPVIKSQDDAKTWIDEFPHLKEIMDKYFCEQGGAEREYQQLLARENNCSIISNETDYFITDIEYADSNSHARIDLLAIRWLATAPDRKDGSKCRVVLIEMKYGDGALGKKAGLSKHLKDIEALVIDKEKYSTLLKMMELQFNQLDELKLLNFHRCSNRTTVKLDANAKPEVILVLASHNPRSTKLSSIIDSSEVDKYGQTNLFDLRFFVSNFAGYGLHSKCMLTLAQFRDLLKKSNAE